MSYIDSYVERIDNKLRDIDDDLENIKKLLVEEYYVSNLKRTILYLIKKYNSNWYETLSQQIDSLIVFITNSISVKYFGDKDVLLDAIRAYYYYFCNRESKDVNLLLNLLQFTDKNYEGEILELLYEAYADAVDGINRYYEECKSCFNVDTNTSIPLRGVDLHETLVDDWKLHKEEIFKKCNDSGYGDFISGRLYAYFNDVVLIEQAAEKAAEYGHDYRLGTVVSFVKDEYYGKGKKREKTKPGYVKGVEILLS